MPIIASHHRNHPWRPQQAWPDTCSVQWGDSGVVFSREGSYRTAFFEAFPQDGSGGFIRGEGESLEEAELAAFERWSRQLKCAQQGGHRWTRARRLSNGKVQTYTNGGCFCLECRAFKTAMHPIVTLGGWREPFTSSELNLVADGYDWGSSGKEARNARRYVLRARASGIPIPDWKEYTNKEVYTLACGRVVAKFYMQHRDSDALAAGAEGILNKMFDAACRAELENLTEEHGFSPSPKTDYL